ARNLALGLAGAGHHMSIVTPGGSYRVSDGSVSVQQVRIHHLPLVDRVFPGAGACWRIARAMRRVVRDEGIHVVEFPNWEGLGLLFQSLTRTPVVVRLHTSSRETQRIDELTSTRRLEWDVRRERWQCRRADALVTHSRAHRRTMSEELEIPEERIELIPHGVLVNPHFQRPRRAKGPPMIVYLGRMEKRKGTLDLLKAVPTVLAKHPQAKFIFIGGDRPHCPAGRTHAQYLAEKFPAAVQQQVTLAGRLPQDEVDRWLQTADIFVAPSLYESFGLIFPEAMRWGTPVIGTRVGGIPEIITDNETGLLVDPQSPEQLASTIVRLLENRELRERLGSAGRRHVETHFTVERMARQTAELYREIIVKRSAKRALATR
ncbi:MAG TPA: glycosyltransferase family 4 protein, partial [Pirellulaceae bacterium]|nr:glycosyltransferase family 4 protein [Pirellulaceae bacterium]